MRHMLYTYVIRIFQGSKCHLFNISPDGDLQVTTKWIHQLIDAALFALFILLLFMVLFYLLLNCKYICIYVYTSNSDVSYFEPKIQ